MTTRTSNSLFLTVLPAQALEGIGWTVRVLSERDYASTVAEVRWFAGLGFTVEANDVGGGTVTLDADDSLFSASLPLGETTRLADQEALWQVLEDGQVRFEFLAEDVDEDVIPDGGGPRQTVIAGRGTGAVLGWAPVLPAGMPTPSSMSREFTAKPMDVWAQLFAEAQAAGYLDWVSLTFDGSLDSQGVAWDGDAQALTVQAGDNLLDLLTRWCEANEYAWRMLPGFRLWVTQTSGVHHEDTVVFTQYRAQGEHKRKITRRELANVVYADSGDNGIAFAEDSASATKWRKRATWVSAGDASDATARSMIANTSLSLAKDQKLSRSVRIIPDRLGRQPFVDFDVQDWISVEVPDDDVESGARKVMGLAVQIDADGAVEYEATLSSRWEVRAVKTQKILDKLGGSKASGDASAPIPVSKSLSVVKLADLSDVDLTSPSVGSLLQWNGSRWLDVVGNLDLLADVAAAGASAPTDGQVLTYQSSSGLWKPATASSGGGGSTPTIRATATNYGNTGNVASVTIPATAVVGDLLVVGVGSNYGYAGLAVSAGWNLVTTALNGSFHNMNLWWKVCTAGDIGAVPTFTMQGSEPWNAGCAVVKDWTRITAAKTVQSSSGTTLGTGATILAGKSDLLLLFGTARVGARVLTFGRGALVVGRAADASLSSTLWSLPAGGLISDTLTSPAGTSGLGIGAVAIA